MAPRMTKSKIYSYMRNVGRSFGYAMVDSVSSMNPTVTALFKSTAEQSKDLYESIKNFDGKSLGFESNLKGTLSEGLRDLKNNALDDIRTGKWYNKDRKNAIESQMAEEALGINFDDFGDFDDFNFDDTDLDEQASIQEDATRTTAHAMDVVGSKVSGAVSTAAIKSADYIVESGRLNTKALYNLNLSGFGQVNKGVAAINGNLQLLVSLAEPLTTHMQNSALFYTKSQEYYNESLTLLKQIASNTAPKSSNNYSSSKKSKGYMDYITSEGIIDFAGMIADGGKRIKENTEMITSLMSIVPGGEKAIIKMATASPLQFALTAAIGQLFNVKDSKGRSIRSSFEDFNKVLSNFSVGLLGRMKTAKFGDGLLSPFLRGIRDFLMPNQKTIKKVDPSKYEKGKVDWDGMSRKALMDVIPTQLAQIISLLEGTNDIRVFDYNKGRFVRSSRIAGKYKVDMKNMTNRAGGDLFRYVNKSIDKTNMSTADKRAYKKQVEKLLEYAVMSDDNNFLNFLSDNFDFEKIGMDKRVGRDIQNRVKAISKQKGGKYALSSFAGNVYSARSNVSRYHENPDSSLVSMYNGSFRPTHGSKLIDMKDEFGYSQGEYFRMIISHLSYITKNMKNLVAIPGVGGFNAEGTQIVWEDGDDITKSNHVNSTADGSSDRFKRAGEVRGPLYNDIDSSVAAAMGNDNAGLFDLTEDEKKYEASKGKPGFKFNQEMEDAIKRKKTAQKGLNKAKGFAGEAYDRLKGSKVGGILSSIEDRLEMSTEKVADALDKMSEGLNRFVYDNKSGLFALMDTMSMGVLSMLKEFIPKPVRDLLGAGWQKFKDSSFGKATFGTLKNIGLSFFGKPGYRSKAESFDPDTRAAAAEQMDFDLEEMGYDKGRFGRGSGLVNNFYSRSRRANFWNNYSRGSFSGSASDIPTFRKVRTIPRSRSYRSRRFSGGASSTGDEEAASGDEDISDPSLKSFFSSIASSIGNKLMDKIAGFTSSIDPKKEKEKVKGTMQKLMEEAGLGKGAIGAGAFIGAGTSLLTGAFLGPIAGAAIGAAVGFVSKSETAQKFLFGEWNKEKGEYEGNSLLPKEVGKFFKEHGAATGKGAGAGAIIGTFAGSPILGAIVGATAGYVSSSQKAKEWIFGKDEDGKKEGGLIPSGLIDTIKKRFPFMATGAGTAILLAPGPLVPKLVIGATLGAIAGEDGGKGLKEWFFGEKDENGNYKLNAKGKEKKGFIGFINDYLFKPMLGTVDKAFNMITKGLKDSITQGTRKIFSVIGGLLQKTKIGQGALNVGKGLAKATGGLAHAPVWLAGLPFRAANTALERAALRNGTAFRGKDNRYLTSAERVKLANDKTFELRDSGSRSVDEYLAGLQTEDEYERFIEAMKAEEKNRGASQGVIDDIIANSKNGDLKRFLGKNLKYGDITHAIQQAEIDKKALRDKINSQKEEEESTDGTIRIRIPNLLQTISTQLDWIVRKSLGQDPLTHGLTENFNANSEHSASQQAIDAAYDRELAAMVGSGMETGSTDSLGRDMALTENPMVEEDERASNIGRIKMKNRATILGGISSLPLLGTGIDKVRESIESLKDGLLGNGGKKKGLFEWIKETLVGENGLLGGILGFFTGATGIGGLVGKLLTRFPLKTALASGLGLGALALAFGGTFDELVEKIGNLPFFKGNDTLSPFGNNESSEAVVPEAEGYTDKNGVYHKYIDSPATRSITTKNGIEKTIYKDIDDDRVKVGEDNTLATRLKKNLISGTLLGKGTVTSAVIKKTTGLDITTKGASKALANIGEKGLNLANGGVINGIMTSIAGALEKIPGILKAIPFLPSEVADNAETIVTALYSNLDDAVKNVAKSPKIMSIASTLSKTLVVLQIGYVVGKGINAWGNAESILGITEEATAGQRVIAVLISVVNALIPVIGDLIPEKALVNIFMSIAPNIGIDVSSLQEQREKANAEVQAYIDATGDTSMNIEKYNQLGLVQNKDGTFSQGKARAGIITRAKMKVGGFIDNVKDQGFSKALADTGVGKALGNIGGKIKQSASSVIDVGKMLGEYVKNGDIAGLWKSKYQGEDDADNPMGGLMNIVYTMGKMSMTMPTLYSAIGRGIVNKFKSTIETFKNMVERQKEQTDIAEEALFGEDGVDLGKLFSFDEVEGLSEGNPFAWVTKVVSFNRRMSAIPGVLLKHAGIGIVNVFKKVGNAVKNGFTKYTDMQNQLWDNTKKGDIKELISSQYEDEEGNPMGGFFGGLYNISKFFATPTAGLFFIGNKIKSGIESLIDGGKDDATYLDSVNKYFKEQADAGEVGKIFNYETTFKSKGLVGTFFNIGTTISKVIYTAIGIFNKFIGPLKDVVMGIKEKVGNVAEAVGEKVSGVGKWWEQTKQYAKEALTQGSASGSGVVSQLDPRYRKYRVGGRSFAYNGCGPASAVMAAGGRLSDAVNIAQKYQTAGGTDAAYFGEMFNRQGMSANYYLAGGSSLIGDIASGKPTVLMGQDVYNTSKANSPFGPNNHYVVANGFDRSGNLLISDPEQRGIRRYNPNILRNVKVGVSGGSSAYAASMQSGNLNTTSTSDSTSSAKSAQNYSSGVFAAPKTTTTSKASSYDDLKADAGKKESIAQKSGKDLSSVGLGSSTSGVSNVPMTAENCANGNLGMWSPVTAEEMNSWIASKSSDSPFNGNGEIFIKAAQASGLDPRYILAHAAVESGWGKSNIALTKNNYFGIGAFDTNPSAAYTFAAGASNDGLATGIIEGAKWIADHYYKGKYNQTSVYRMRYNNGVHQYCTSETWVGSIGSIMASGPVNTKLTLDDTPVSLVQNSVDYSTSDVGDNPDETVKSGAESKVSLGGILSTITSAFANAFGALFNGSSEDGETEHGGSYGTFGEDSGSVNLSGSDPVSYMEGIKGKVKYTFGSHDIENGKGDCSGTVGWAVNKATGLNIGGNTLAMYNNTKNLKSVWYQGGKTSASAPAGAKRNDILLFSRPNSSYTVGRPDRVGHVGLYMGDNKYIHIGQGTGPYESSLNQSANLIKVSRLIDDNGNEINFTGDQEVNYQGVPGATSVHEVYDSETKSVKKSTAVKSSSKFGSNKITESAMGSGLINYGPSRAGNYILNDTSRNYYKQSGSSSSLSGGASNISFGNLMTTAGNTIRNAYNSAKQRGKDTLSVPTNVASIASDTNDIKKSIAAIAEVLTTIQDAKQNNSTRTNNSTPSRFSDELADSLSELRNVTNSITAV